MTKSSATLATLLLVGGIGLSFPASVATQTTTNARRAPLFYWGIDVGVATLAGLFHGQIHHAAPQRAIVAGIVGGSLMYGGQRMVGAGDPALNLPGLETVALGANLTRNIGSGVAPFSDLTFPFFPLYVRIRPGRPAPLRVRISALGLYSTIRMSLRYGQAPDWGRSLISGAVVFTCTGQLLLCEERQRTGCSVVRVGEHRFGAVAYAHDPLGCTRDEVLAHELGHVAQDIRDAILFAVPASDYALDHTGRVGRWIGRVLVVDAVLPLMLTSRLVGPPDFDPACHGFSKFYECEAEAMTVLRAR